jgi:hypothetical protein
MRPLGLGLLVAAKRRPGPKGHIFTKPEFRSLKGYGSLRLPDAKASGNALRAVLNRPSFSNERMTHHTRPQTEDKSAPLASRPNPVAKATTNPTNSTVNAITGVNRPSKYREANAAWK